MIVIHMKKIIVFLIPFLACSVSYAQFGYKKKEELDKIKDTRTVVVLNNDSAYNASIKAAVEKYWGFTGTIFAYDTALKPYNKPDFTFLVFSKSKGSKIKPKVCSSEEDFNGLQLVTKFKRKALPEEIIAQAYCSNKIDTPQWQPEMVRAVQMLNNYFNYAMEANGELTPSNYPTDKSQMMNKKLLVPDKLLQMKGKEDANTLLDGEVEEVDREDIDKAIVSQDPATMYFFFSFDEKHCNKLVLSSERSELMYFGTDSPEKCSCTAKELKVLKSAKTKANKE
jgi:hypothetical protein